MTQHAVFGDHHARLPLHFVPYVNSTDLLDRALDSIADHADRTVLVDNRDAFGGIDKYELQRKIAGTWKTPVPLSHAQMMTWLVTTCQRMEFSYFTWMHHDCEVVEDSLAHLIEMAKKFTESGRQWGIILTQDSTKGTPWNHVDVLSAINVDAVLAVGAWDWVRFPDVFSDYDLYSKLVKAGYEIVRSGLEVRHMQGGSTTVANDPNRAEVKRVVFPAYAELWRLRSAAMGLTWPPA